MRHEIINEMERTEKCVVCGSEHKGACPNCGSEDFQREFHPGELTTEVFCAKCGFVIFG